MFKVNCKSGSVSVACCSLCFSKSLLGYYALHDLSETTLSSDAVFGCRHTCAVTQNRLAAAHFNCSTKNEHRAWIEVSTTMTSYESVLQPGWINCSNKLSTGKGQINGYISEEYTMLIFAATISQSNTVRLWCFVCSKYGCHHSSTVTHELMTISGANLPQQIPTIRLPAAALTNMKSNAKYPCNAFKITW